MAKPNRKHQQAHEADAEIEGLNVPEVKGPEVVHVEPEVKEPEVPEVTQVEAEAVQTPEYLIAKHGNKSKAIRALNADGKTRSEIAKLLGIRYQHVNNVLGQVLKREIKAERDAKANGNGQAVTQ